MLKDLWKVLRQELSSARVSSQDEHIVGLYEQIEEQRQTIARQNLAIREMDNIIFQMSQAPDLDALRRLLGKLTEPMMQRKQLESKRISDILVKEIKETYTP